MAKKNLTHASVAALLCCVAIEGWSMEHGVGYVDSDGETWTKDGYGDNAKAIKSSFALFKKVVDDLHVTIALNVRARETKHTEYSKTFSGVVVEGHTRYNGRTFTRRGVDVCSCNLQDEATSYAHSYTNLPALLEGEFARCKASADRAKTMVEVPGLPGGWKVTPERKEEVTKTLRAGKVATFMPSGFGVGYNVTSRATSRFATRLPKTTQDFFGVLSPLFYETMDCD